MKGSHATWDGMPRVCFGCHKPLTMKHETLWLDTFRRESWHHDCKLADLRAAHKTERRTV